MVASQHVQNISTLTEEQNGALLKQLEHRQAPDENQATNTERATKNGATEGEPTVAVPPVVTEGMMTRGKKKQKVSFVWKNEEDDIQEEDVSRFMNVGLRQVQIKMIIKTLLTQRHFDKL